MGCGNSTCIEDDIDKNSAHLATFRHIKALEQMLRLNVTPISHLADLGSYTQGVIKMALSGDSRFQGTTLYYYPALKRIFIVTLIHRNALGQFPIRSEGNDMVQLYVMFNNVCSNTYIIGRGLVTNYPYSVYENEFTIRLNPKVQPTTPYPENFSLRITSKHVTLGQLCGLSFVLTDSTVPTPI